MSVKDILAKHPAPWRYSSGPNGLVTVFDAANAPVPLFVMLDLMVIVTARMSTPAQPTAQG
jgi:hypothetical protein